MQLQLSHILLDLISLAALSTSNPLPNQLSSNNVAELGINCRGSLLCNWDRLAEIRDLIKTIGPERHYSNGEYIACVEQPGKTKSSECAFLQNTANGLLSSEIMNLIDLLVGHGCANCGSIPIGYPASNDPAPGILTVNYVADQDCGEKKELGCKWKELDIQTLDTLEDHEAGLPEK